MTLLIGQTAPNFTQKSTVGALNFYEWSGEKWVIFFSHPADFTPVCTTELGAVARLGAALAERNARALALSVDSVASHQSWIGDIERTQGAEVNFPIVADEDASVATLYGMIHPESDRKLTVRSVFFIDPKRKVRATLSYPPATGRDFGEILRVLDGLQLTDKHAVATPANWRPGHDVVVLPSITDPTELRQRFPKGYQEVTPYLRTTPQP